MVWYSEKEYSYLLGTLFLIASITDYADGIYARKFDKKTLIGSVMDPIADKILLIAGLSILYKLQIIDLWILVSFTILEFLIAGAREFMARLGKVNLVLPNFISNRKIDFQFIGVTLLFYNFLFIGTIFIYIALLITILSLISKMIEVKKFL
jgi:CDP-diacylglycerol--glycerol-3-phosphate 3-phosphatidyltransferase